MFNILSYVGMNLQSELCLWTMLGLLRTIFDATLFKVNANLKQVWQMNMPSELTMPVQRVLRTMISGVMLVQCFTVYVYLATYIVLLYPVFLEERPTLVLPWLLLAAIRKFLCEFTSLALGLGACVLLGPARPPCIKFVLIKVVTITPAFYMWMMVFSYYHALKVASTFKTFSPVLPISSDHNCGLELAVRRRRTKSLLGEEQLRKKLVATFDYGSRQNEPKYPKLDISSRMVHSTDTNQEDLKELMDVLHPLSVNSERILSDMGSFEDWYGNDVIVPRDTDRILEQFVLMLLRISSYLKAEELTDPTTLFSSPEPGARFNRIECEYTDTPPQVGNNRGHTASYLQEYPHIFMKKTDAQQFQEQAMGSLNTLHNNIENDEHVCKIKSQLAVSVSPGEVYDRKKTCDRKIPIKESTSFTHLPDCSKKENNGNDIKRQTKNEEPHIELPEDNNNEFAKVERDVSRASVDSIQCIIDRMKKSLSQNKKSTKQVQNHKEADRQSNRAVSSTNSKNMTLDTKKRQENSKDNNKKTE